MNKKALLPLIGLFLLVTGIVLPGSAHAQISEGDGRSAKGHR